jgi:hypothetical protein
MTLCPIAMVAGCKKCLAVQLCPVKTVVIGDYEKPVENEPEQGAEKVQASGKQDE